MSPSHPRLEECTQDIKHAARGRQHAFAGFNTSRSSWRRAMPDHSSLLDNWILERAGFGRMNDGSVARNTDGCNVDAQCGVLEDLVERRVDDAAVATTSVEA